MIKCPNCNAELAFSAKLQQVTCNYCQTKFNPRQLHMNPNIVEEQKTFEGKNYLCSQCGASILTFDDTAITFCNYCGCQAMIESKMVKLNQPHFIIPFKKTKEECIIAYKKKISRALFVPKKMKSDININKFRGIYIPYCIYKLSFKGDCINNGEKYVGRDNDYKLYEEYKITTNVDAFYDGLSFDLISNFYDKFSYSIPYNYKEAEKFNFNYLAGYYADALDVDSSLYDEIAKNIASDNTTVHLKKLKIFKNHGCYYPKINLNIEEKKVGMFPVYFLAIRDKKNQYVHYAVVNGQTGKVAADLPIDLKKYILISLLLAIPIFLLINNFLVIIPKYVCIFSIIISIICVILSIYQLKKINQRENHLDDIGYMKNSYNIKCKTNKIKFKSKFRLFLSIISMLAITGFLYINLLKHIGLPSFVEILILVAIILLNINGIIKKNKVKEENKTIKFKKATQRNNKLSLKKYFRYTYKHILSIIIGIVVILYNFVDDIYYYGATVTALVLIIWGFSDLIKLHNILASTKLPQLEKRGGDKNK